MTILSGKRIAEARIFTPTEQRQRTASGLSYGVGPAGYDVRIDTGLVLEPGEFALVSIREHIAMPADCLGIVHDKSSWARMGLAVQNTVVEPGWRGHLTIELTNHSAQGLTIAGGEPIAQIIVHRVEGKVEPYDGAYQDQTPGVTPSILASAPQPGEFTPRVAAMPEMSNEQPPRGLADPNVDVQRIRILETRLRQMARAREVLLNNVIEEAARIAQKLELSGHTGAAEVILALKKNVASVPPEPEPGEAEAIVIGGARVHSQNQE